MPLAVGWRQQPISEATRACAAKGLFCLEADKGPGLTGFVAWRPMAAGECSMAGCAVVTGGAGFLGSALALRLAREGWDVIAVDNLSRRGSELNLERLATGGVRVVTADVRDQRAMARLPHADVVFAAAAETSVLGGLEVAADQVVGANVVGAVNAFEIARRGGGVVILASSSRVYPATLMSALVIREEPTRFVLADDQGLVGASGVGISEAFPLGGVRSIYGASKLSAEFLLHEFCDAFELQAVINRFGVLAGPWQMGNASQGVFAHWMLAHVLGWPLAYVGFGGCGKQVRDVLHVDDAVDLIVRQAADPETWNGGTYNVGGGTDGTLSLAEATKVCVELSGRSVPIHANLAPRPWDIPVYISDMTRLFAMTEWRPSKPPTRVMEDIHDWASRNRTRLRALLGPEAN